MRWDGTSVAAGATEDPGALPGLGSLRGLVRTVTTPEFTGITFHEVLARSALNKIPGDGGVLPFSWTINPYRGCSHACVYCFARATHRYLDLDAGDDFDRQLVVKVNVAEVLAREVRRAGWTRQRVALGTNTDPYQRAEGRYRLMPGIIAALAGSATPFSILTKGSLARRDLPLLVEAAEQVEVGFAVSIALLDEDVHTALEPGAPSPRARLELVRSVTDAGLTCQVLVAPVLPLITDADDQLDALLAAIADAGATHANVLPLHLRPDTREWFWARLETYRPDLLHAYTELYRGGPTVLRSYASDLAARAHRLLRRHGLTDAPFPRRRPREPTLF